MTDWAIPQQAKLKYTQLFNLHDRSRSGFLSGLQCRDILLQSGLPRNILAEIWNLSDIDGDGQLTREEFILAMHLTNHVRSGQTLPNELAPDLIPPSYRRTRSISATSVHSATSASSSVNDDQVSQKSSDNLAGPLAGSILNSNSFEDKRRENFEKGRAELERRRLRIIEQQTGILKEQLAASKKQVAEAKAKIDAMRPERDTKMGLITSLEAQLKTFQDRKAYLNQEEQNLIAIAKDLNLVNPTQAEPDQLATQAKQQSINQMKEKIDEFAKEKEEKSKELAEVIKRVEESKKQLKSISDEASKTYEIYKEKVKHAKVLREQFITENKSKTPDLDSAWGSEPVFTPKALDSSPVIQPQASDVDDPWGPSTNTAFTPPAQSSAIKQEDADIAFSPNVNATEPISGFGDEQGFPGPVQQNGKKYKAVYAFEGRYHDELNINPGDIITVLEGVTEPGWLIGELDGKKGLFPEAYVEPFQEDTTEEEVTPTPTTAAATTTTAAPPPQDQAGVGKSRPSKRAEVATVIANYQALGQEQLNLEKGQLVLIRRKMDSGWWEGEVQVKDGFKHSATTTIRRKLRLANRLNKRDELAHLIAELIETETDYVNDLRLCYNIYISPLSSSFDLNNIFVRWEDLIKVHELTLEKLSCACFKKSDRSIDYACVFVIYKELLTLIGQLYNEFCSQQKESARRFEAKVVSDIRFRQLVNDCHRGLDKLLAQQVESRDHKLQQQLQQQQAQLQKSLPPRSQSFSNSRLMRNSKLPVTSFMLKPMQRITKYNLLFVRILNVIKSNGPQELIHQAEELNLMAQALCSEVNEACRLKEDAEDNKRKLKWAQDHIIRQVNLDKIAPLTDTSSGTLAQAAEQSLSSISTQASSDYLRPLPGILDLEDSGSSSPHTLAPSSSSVASLSSGNIILDSETKNLGPRRLLKAGCLIKSRSNKEVALFLFSDMLFITKVRGGSISPPLKVENVFLSERAKRSYYKLISNPIFVEDLLVHGKDSVEENAQLSYRCSWPEQQFYIVSFTTKSTGKTYSFSALSEREQTEWLKQLEGRSLEARNAVATTQSLTPGQSGHHLDLMDALLS